MKLKSVLFCLLLGAFTPELPAQIPAEAPPPVFKENFDKAEGWLKTDKCYVDKGKYYANGDCVIPVRGFVYDDFELEVVAMIYTGGEWKNPGALSAASQEVQLPTVGLSFRISQDGYYRLLIAPLTGGKEGIYRLLKIEGGKQTELTGWRRDLAISARNIIKLRCAGGKMELSINNLRVADFKDETFKSGAINLFYSGGLASFDDLVIKSLKK